MRAVVFGVTVVIVRVRGEWRRPTSYSYAQCYSSSSRASGAGLSWLCYFRALEIGPVSGVVSVEKLSVVLVVAMSAILLGEWLTWQVAIGALLLAVGAFMVSLPISSSGPGRSHRWLHRSASCGV